MQYGSDGYEGLRITCRRCKVCGETKPIEAFRIATPKGARRYECRVCEKLMSTTIREANALNWPWIENRRKSWNRYRLRNLDKIKEYQREYHRKYRARKKAERHGKLVDNGPLPGSDS